MSRPRVLVVRSGANPFQRFGAMPQVDIVERVSHSIEPVAVGAEAFPEDADMVVFTSQVAVERVIGDPELAGRFDRIAERGQTVAVGSATERALRERGRRVDLVAEGSGESLLEHLPRRLEGRHVLLPCGEDASPDVPEGLRARGARVTRVVVYRKVPRRRDPDLEREILERPFAAFCTTSPSAARWLMTGLSEAASERLKRTPAVVLGSFTRRYLEGHGVEHIAVTEEARFEAAARLLERVAEGSATDALR